MHVHPEAGRHFSFVLSGSFLGPAFARLQRRRRPGAPSAERTRASKDLRLKGSPVSEAGFVTFGTLSKHFTHSPKLGFVAEGGAYYNRRSLCVPADPASVGSLQPGQLSPCSPLLSAGSRRGTTRARERGKARRSRKPPFLPCAVPPLGEGGEKNEGGCIMGAPRGVRFDPGSWLWEEEAAERCDDKSPGACLSRFLSSSRISFPFFVVGRNFPRGKFF